MTAHHSNTLISSLSLKLNAMRALAIESLAKGTYFSLQLLNCKRGEFSVEVILQDAARLRVA